MLESSYPPIKEFVIEKIEVTIRQMGREINTSFFNDLKIY